MRIPFLFALVSLFSSATAWAQPTGDAQVSVQAPMPMQPPQAQPMRFILTNGTTIIGTEAGGDAEWLMIQTPTGVMQVRRNEIASMDYQTGQPAVTVMAQPQQQPIYMAPQPPPRRRGRGLLIAGAIVFGISYGLSALVGITAGQESPSALWFILPVAGPLMWASQTDCGSDLEDACRSLAYTFGFFVTLVQAAGVTMLAVGMAMRSGDDGQVQQAAVRPPRLALSPILQPGYQGLALQTRF